MSITFWIPAAPKDAEVVDCDFPGCVEGNRCGYCVDGMDVIDTSEAPEVNMSETNAAHLLALLSQTTHDDEFGSWQVGYLPMIRRAIMRIRANANSRKHLVNEVSETFNVRVVNGPDGVSAIERGCRVINCGNTDEQTMRRLDKLEAVVIYAQVHGWEVHWG